MHPRAGALQRVMAQRAVMKQQVRPLETQVIEGAVGLDKLLFFRRQAEILR